MAEIRLIWLDERRNEITRVDVDADGRTRVAIPLDAESVIVEEVPADPEELMLQAGFTQEYDDPPEERHG